MNTDLLAKALIAYVSFEIEKTYADNTTFNTTSQAAAFEKLPEKVEERIKKITKLIKEV